MEFYYQIGEELKTVTIQPDNDRFQVTIGDQSYLVNKARLRQGQLTIEIDGQPLRVYIAHEGSRRYVAAGGETWVLERLATAQSRGGGGPKTGAGPATLEATMPGLVVAILAGEGELVERGQTLVLLEAMKMELRVTAPYTGRVRRVNCAPGQVVERGQMLVEMEER
jgi:acetyl/propionyl-CoA carboxylase alpha subunit